MPIEPITFGDAVNTGKAALLLEDGQLVECSGFSFDKPGDLTARDALYAVNGTAVGSINGIHRYINWLLATDAGALRYKWDLNGYCDLYTPANEDFTLLGYIGAGRPRFADMDDFTFIVNGQCRKAFSGAMYDWNIDNPTQAPAGTDGASGNPSGTYSLYYSFLILFPNGRTYETDTSPAGTVSVTSKAISWSGIGLSTYAGTGVKIYRKLYRYSTGLGDTYYVDTIKDNTTTTYTDDFSDATLQENDILDTTAYAPAPEGMVDVANYLSRIFGIKANTLYYSEAYLPFAFKGTSTIAVTRPGEDLKNCIPWGDQLYLGWPASWKRLQGADADTWAIKGTFSEQGPINTHTTKKTRFGILFQWYDGLYLFDGQVSRNITAKDLGTAPFTGIVNPSLAHAEFDGEKYWFVYPSTGTTLDKCLIVDFRQYPNVRFYNHDFIPSAYEFHFQTGRQYFGKTDGYQYKVDDDAYAELITNGTDWTGATGSTPPTGWTDRYGTATYTISSGELTITSGTVFDGIAQAITVTPGIAYTFSVDAYGAGAGTAIAGVGNTAFSRAINQASSTSVTKETLSMSFTPTQSTVYVTLQVVTEGHFDTASCKLTVDPTIATALQTGDRAMQQIVKQKNLSKLYYDIDTGGEDVTVTIYADGTAQTPTYTLNKASRTRSSIDLANHQGYHFAVRLSCSDSAGLHIYEPWALEYTPFGD